MCSVFMATFPKGVHRSTLGSLQGRDIQLLGKPQHIFVCLAFWNERSLTTLQLVQSWSLRFANAKLDARKDLNPLNGTTKVPMASNGPINTLDTSYDT